MRQFFLWFCVNTVRVFFDMQYYVEVKEDVSMGNTVDLTTEQKKWRDELY